MASTRSPRASAKPRSRPKSTVIKKTKTFTGCWTCRARRVKCDEARPTCSRCTRGKLSCEGYGLRLIWDWNQGGEPEKEISRRVLLAPRTTSSGQTFTRREVNSALRKLEDKVSDDQILEGPKTITIGPFSVFQNSGASNHGIQPLKDRECANEETELATPASWTRDLANIVKIRSDHEAIAQTELAIPDRLTRDTPAEYEEDEETDWTVSELASPNIAEIYTDCDGDKADEMVPISVPSLNINHNIQCLHISDYESIQASILSLIQPSPCLGSKDERRLIHFWTTSSSNLMTINKSPDNPFRTVYLPLALASSEAFGESPGHSALFHAICAAAAFNSGYRSSSKERDIALGTKHHHLSLRYLRQGVLAKDDTQREAILAAIITMSSIDVIKGHESNWRVHIRGGRSWLNSVNNIAWTQTRSSSVLYQIFLCVEAFGSYSGETHLDSNPFEGVFDGAYHLDSIFGITKPVLKSILSMNRMLRGGKMLQKEELDSLELDLLMSDPSNRQFENLEFNCAQATRHQACAFHLASLIYFKRVLGRQPRSSVQSLVQKGIDHLDQFDILTQDSNVTGFLWPAFVIACEADGHLMRSRIAKWFVRGERYGVGNISAAGRVVEELWCRRDLYPENESIHGNRVMEEMGFDILFT